MSEAYQQLASAEIARLRAEVRRLTAELDRRVSWELEEKPRLVRGQSDRAALQPFGGEPATYVEDPAEVSLYIGDLYHHVGLIDAHGPRQVQAEVVDANTIRLTLC